jgi:hypothetical protein
MARSSQVEVARLGFSACAGGRSTNAALKWIGQTIDLFSLTTERLAGPASQPHARRHAATLDKALQRHKCRPVQQRKVSATFLAYVEPVFLTRGAPPPDKYREILRLGVMVWNAAIIDEHRGTDYLSELRSRIRTLDDVRSRALMLALVDDLVDRKRSTFSEDQWLIGHWEIIPQPGGNVRVRVEARTLLPET